MLDYSGRVLLSGRLVSASKNVYVDNRTALQTETREKIIFERLEGEQKRLSKIGLLSLNHVMTIYCTSEQKLGFMEFYVWRSKYFPNV